jgi:hypothetical protein
VLVGADGVVWVAVPSSAPWPPCLRPWSSAPDDVGEEVGIGADVRPADDEEVLDEEVLDEEVLDEEVGEDEVLSDVVDVGTVVTTEESPVVDEPLGAAA